MKRRNLLFSLVELVVCAVVLAGIADVCVTLPPAPTPPTPPDEPDVVDPLAASMLPIEVLGPNGTIRSVQVVVTNGHTADNLWFWVDNLSYEGKMAVRANGGPWVPLNDANVVYLDREFAQYGMGGISSALRFHYVIDGAWPMYNGTNIFDFRFADADGKTIGFRILDFTPRAGTTRLLHPSQLPQEDPLTWTVPGGDSNAGSNIWFTATIKERGTNINARCNSCHVRGGWDLKYFNYSPKSIVERSIFHGLTPTDSTNVAAFILSRPVPYVAAARPWNPVYQPGPGMDAKPVHEWAAGAGWQWVMENGTNGLAHMFPSGIVTNWLNLNVPVNAREIPISIPFATWNKWLPEIHPLDLDPVFFATNRFHTIYFDIETGISNLTGSAAAKYFNGRKTVWDNAGGITPPGDNWAWIRHRRHWRVVQTFGFMNRFAIQEFGAPTDGVFTNQPNLAPIDDRRWFHGEVFRLGPHVIPGSPKNDNFYWESAQWYQTQLVLNSANRLGGSIVPIDWGYQHALPTSAWGNPGNFVTYDVTVLNIIKALEVGFNGRAMTDTHGFNPYKANIWRLESQYFRTYMNTLPNELRRAVAGAVGIRWIEEMEARTPAEFAAAGRLEPSLDGLFDDLLLWWGATKLDVDPALVTRQAVIQATLFP